MYSRKISTGKGIKKPTGENETDRLPSAELRLRKTDCENGRRSRFFVVSAKKIRPPCLRPLFFYLVSAVISRWWEHLRGRCLHKRRSRCKHLRQ